MKRSLLKNLSNLLMKHVRCRLKKAAADYKRQAGEAKRRLEAALQDQRRLALKARRGFGGLQTSCSLHALAPC